MNAFRTQNLDQEFLDSICDRRTPVEIFLKAVSRSNNQVGHFDDSISLSAAVVKLHKEDCAVYFRLNPSNSQPVQENRNSFHQATSTNCTTNDQVSRIRFLFIDIDADRPTDVCATQAEKAKAKSLANKLWKYLKTKDWPDSWNVDSGNGYYLLYDVDLPTSASELIKEFLHAIADRFDGDGAHVDRGVFDAARLARLPGTWNRKGENTDERPHRVCKVLRSPKSKNLLDEQLIEDVINELKSSTDQSVSNPYSRVRQARNYVAKMPPAISGHQGHDQLFAVACRLVEFGLTDDEAHPILKEYNQRCQPAWGVDELTRKLKEARKKVGTNLAGTTVGFQRPSTDPKLDLPALDGKEFFGFVPDFMMSESAGLMDFAWRENDLLTRSLKFFSLYQCRQTPILTSPEFVRQFFWSVDRPRNWRATLQKKLTKYGFDFLDSHRSRSDFENCIFCNSNGPKHTHSRFEFKHYGFLREFAAFESNTGQRYYRADSLAERKSDFLKNHQNVIFAINDPRFKKEKNTLFKDGTLRLFYWPSLLFGAAAGLSKWDVRFLLGMTNELTREKGKPFRVVNAMIPGSSRGKMVSCPELSGSKDCDLFGGNGRRRGMGYTLFGRTGKGWASRTGWPDVHQSDTSSQRDFCKEFFCNLARLCEQLEIEVVAYHSGTRQWKALPELVLISNSLAGFNWISQSTIRFLAPADWCLRWRYFFSKRLGYKWIPGSSYDNGPFDDVTGAVIKLGVVDLQHVLTDFDLTHAELAERMSAINGSKVSTKRIQRHLSGARNESQFYDLLGRTIGSITVSRQ